MATALSATVKIKACGICGSDLHEYLFGPIFMPVRALHPISGDVVPIIMGNQFAGKSL
ncbi:MAG: alcohol dehydrogenase catalytic domain-containing protein [Balneolaceae bacterium]|nr:alcohol dehydrogenase catalytic domain-containing protein [Balneolaceae bacterium]